MVRVVLGFLVSLQVRPFQVCQIHQLDQRALEDLAVQQSHLVLVVHPFQEVHRLQMVQLDHSALMVHGAQMFQLIQWGQILPVVQRDPGVQSAHQSLYALLNQDLLVDPLDRKVLSYHQDRDLPQLLSAQRHLHMNNGNSLDVISIKFRLCYLIY